MIVLIQMRRKNFGFLHNVKVVGCSKKSTIFSFFKSFCYDY